MVPGTPDGNAPVGRSATECDRSRCACRTAASVQATRSPPPASPRPPERAQRGSLFIGDRLLLAVDTRLHVRRRGHRRGVCFHPMSGPQKYQGSCHCGTVRYEVLLDLDEPVLSCNCSMCARSGTLLAFVPAENFTLLGGQEALGDYQFNRKVIHHLFCTTCGIKPFARGARSDGTATVAVNVRCLEDVDLEALTVRKVDGRSR
jgi:hypothetical protein